MAKQVRYGYSTKTDLTVLCDTLPCIQLFKNNKNIQVCYCNLARISGFGELPEIAATWSSDNRVVWIGYSKEVGHKMQVIAEVMFYPFLVYS